MPARRMWCYSGTALALLGAVGLSRPANAQDISPTPEPSTAGNEATAQDIVVTASRVARAGYDAPTPTTVVGKDILETRAPSVLVDALAMLPAFRNAATPSTAGIGGSTNGGQSFVDMRALGPNRTLVLLNGQRVVPTTAIATVDISLLPQSLVSRVDVVTGGASAAYGSDAVAGVVNFVLDTKFTGIKGNIEQGISSKGDAESHKFSLAWGTRIGERAHLIVGGEYYHSAGLEPLSRSFTRYPVGNISNPNTASGQQPLLQAPYVYLPNSTLGGIIVGGPLADTEFLPGGATRAFSPCAVRTSSYQLCSGPREDLPWLNMTASYASPETRGSAYARLSYDVTPDVEAYFDGMYAESRTSWTSVPMNTTSSGLITIFRDNAFLPDNIRSQMTALGLNSFQLGRFSTDTGLAQLSRDAQLLRGSFGIDAKLGGSWKLSAYGAYGRSRLESKIGNQAITANFNQAVDAVIDPTTGQAVCRSTLTNPSNGCVPLNLFGVGSPSQAAIDYVHGTMDAVLISKEFAGGVNISGEPFSLWAGPISLAVGGEYRGDEATQTVDPISAAKGYALVNRQPLNGKINVKEVYAETVVPLLKDIPFVKRLEINAAGRITDYSTSGTVETWKAGINYEPLDGIRFRATRSRDIRAPNILELFSQPDQISATADVVDPRTNQTVFVKVFQAGNASLRPEIADTTAAGVVLKPAFAPGLDLSVDYYNIRIDHAISQLSRQDTVNRCEAGDSLACSFVVRNSAGTITQVTTPYFNLQQVKTSGIDFEASYRLSLARVIPGSDASLSFRAVGNYVQKYTITTGNTSVDWAGDISTYSMPKWAWDLSAIYANGDTTVLINGVYRGKGINNVSLLGRLQNNTVDSVWYFNSTIEQKIHAGNTEFTGYIAVNNLFDKEPPFGFGAPGGSGGNYDRIGRYFKIGIRLRR